MPSCSHTLAATSVTLLEGTAGQAIDVDTNGTIDWSKFCIILSALNEYPTVKNCLSQLSQGIIPYDELICKIIDEYVLRLCI